MSSPTPRAIRTETLELTTVPEMLELLDANAPLLWWHHNQGFIGVGVLHELTASGENRFSDLQSQWHALVSQAQVLNPLALPGTGLIALGTFAYRNSSQQLSKLIVPQFVIGSTAGKSWITRNGWADEQTAPFDISLADEILHSPMLPVSETHTAHFEVPAHARDEFSSVVNAAISHITAGELEKVVLARRLSTPVSDSFDLRPALTKLAERYPECWTFCVDGFFGSSPETLITVDQGSFTARVLAGTAPRGADTVADLAAASDLASSTKDLDEHGYAARSVVNSLEPLVQQISVSESPFTLKLPNLWHLATDIAGSLKPGASSLELIAALHPTAAVAGTPTSVAVELIDQLEGFDRGRYAGAVGWVDSTGDGQWALALRCAQLSSSGLEAWAGCGIVAESQADQEFNETTMKFRPIIEALS